MQITLPKLKHPKDGYTIDHDRLIDLNEVFKKRDIGDRDSCVYVFENEFGIPVYIGMGKYHQFLPNTSKFWRSRPFTHKNDLFRKCLRPTWTCRIVACAMTSVEAHILESWMILADPKPLTKRGAEVWDGVSLINKNLEKRWWKYFNEYLYWRWR